MGEVVKAGGACCPDCCLGPWEAAASGRVLAPLGSAWPQSQGIPSQGTRRDFVPEQKACVRLGPAIFSSLLALGLGVQPCPSASLQIPIASLLLLQGGVCSPHGVGWVFQVCGDCWHCELGASLVFSSFL